MLKNYILLKVFYKKNAVLENFINLKVRAPPVCSVIFVYFDRLGVIYDSQVTNMSAVGEGALVGSPSPPCFLLAAWEPYMAASCTVTDFFIAIRNRVKLT
jgi:hypothetical protein